MSQPSFRTSLLLALMQRIPCLVLLGHIIEHGENGRLVIHFDQFKAAQEKQIDQALFLFYGLLLLAIVIALIGIVNTLALSVYERTHETVHLGVGEGTDVVYVAKRAQKPFYVLGLVRKPGEFEFPGNQELRVLDALQTDELCPCNWQKGDDVLKAA